MIRAALLIVIALTISNVHIVASKPNDDHNDNDNGNMSGSLWWDQLCCSIFRSNKRLDDFAPIDRVRKEWDGLRHHWS